MASKSRCDRCRGPLYGLVPCPECREAMIAEAVEHDRTARDGGGLREAARVVVDAQAPLAEPMDWASDSRARLVIDANQFDTLMDAVDDLRDALAFDAQAPDALAWLVERGQSMRQAPTVWLDDSDGWTTDAWKARRFATREECEAFIESRSGFAIPSHGHRFGVAVQHGFAAPAPGRDALRREVMSALVLHGVTGEQACCSKDGTEVLSTSWTSKDGKKSKHDSIRLCARHKPVAERIALDAGWTIDG